MLKLPTVTQLEGLGFGTEFRPAWSLSPNSQGFHQATGDISQNFPKLSIQNGQPL